MEILIQGLNEESKAPRNNISQRKLAVTKFVVDALKVLNAEMLSLNKALTKPPTMISYNT